MIKGLPDRNFPTAIRHFITKQKTVAIFSTALTIVLLPVLICMIVVLIGRNIMTLGADELYFLHEAYAISQHWIMVSYPVTKPYDLYALVLSTFGRIDQPNSLWSMVIFDTICMLICFGALTCLGVSLQKNRSVLSITLAVLGILLFFTVGRLGEHRPDYFSVTFFSFSIYFMMRAVSSDFIKASTWTDLLLAGALLSAAVAFSPRSLVVLAFSIPLWAPYICWTIVQKHSVPVLFVYIGVGTAGITAFLSLLWIATGVVVPDSLALLFQSDAVGRAHSLDFRLFGGGRKLLTSLYALTIIVGLVYSIITNNRRSRLFAFTSVCLSLGQICLIVYSKEINAYGYSYSLVSYLIIIGIVVPNRSKTSPNLTLKPLATQYFSSAFIAVFFLNQLPSLFRSQADLFPRATSWTISQTENSSTDELLASLTDTTLLSERINSRVHLCNRFPKAKYISRFHHNPLCLRSGYLENVSNVAQNKYQVRSIQYPLNSNELQMIANEYYNEIESPVRGIIVGNGITRPLFY